MRKNRGFNLIELMVVVTVIGILASIAVPTYQHYITKARAAHIVSAVSGYKTAIEIAVETGLTSTLTDLKQGALGIPKGLEKTAADRYYLSSLTVANGIITATGNELVDKVKYILTPKGGEAGKVASPVQWTASGDCVTKGFCPDSIAQNTQPIATQTQQARSAPAGSL